MTVEALSGVSHEAFFDPAGLTAGVGANATSGVLKPTTFGSNVLDHIEWESGTLKVNLTGSHVGKHLDFLDVDGELALTVAVDDAVAADGLLTWSVPDQPWESGDLLMVRLYSKDAGAVRSQGALRKARRLLLGMRVRGRPYSFTVVEDLATGSTPEARCLSPTPRRPPRPWPSSPATTAATSRSRRPGASPPRGGSTSRPSPAIAPRCRLSRASGGSASATVTVTVTDVSPEPPPGPTNSTATEVPEGIDLAWDEIEGVPRAAFGAIPSTSSGATAYGDGALYDRSYGQPGFPSYLTTAACPDDQAQ